MARELLRTISPMLLSWRFQTSLPFRSLSTVAQEEAESATFEKSKGPYIESHYKYSDYVHLVEEKRLKRDQLRMMVYRLNRALQSGRFNYPSNLNSEQMLELILLPSWNKRKRFLRYRFEKEQREFRRQNPKTLPKYDEPVIQPWTSTDELPRYTLFRNSIFLRMCKGRCAFTLESTMIHYLPFAQKVVLDFAYDHLMTPREMNKLSIDVKRVHSANRWSTRPLNLHFCSFEPEKSLSARLIHELMIGGRKAPFLYDVTPEPVNKLFPKESLVYLTPEGEETLEKMDPDTVYILGALVDKTNLPGASARRAQELGVRTMRFPASVFLRWEEHGDEKPLHLVQCARILTKVASGSSWEEALGSLEKFLAVDF